MTKGRVIAEFIDGASGRIFMLARRPSGASGSAVLVVPPFAEEMNKCRRMVTQVAQRLAARGVATVIPDLLGTGESEGEFRDGDWGAWKQDLRRAVAWSGAAGWSVGGMLCTRLGCALGAEATREAGLSLDTTVFWQPVTDGRQFMNQFLRLRVAASLGMESRRESVTGLHEQLSAGQSVEVAGYELPARLAAQIDAVRLADSVGPWLGKVTWVELLRSADARVPRRSEETVEGAKIQGVTMSVKTTTGEPFWASTEIVTLPEVVSVTVAALSPNPAVPPGRRPFNEVAESPS